MQRELQLSYPLKLQRGKVNKLRDKEMPHFIGKLKHPKTKKEYYFEWSTIVDAPITQMMSKKDFIEYYKERFGSSGMNELPERMERVERKGNSSCDERDTYRDFIDYNRAGENETRIKTITEMIERYLT